MRKRDILKRKLAEMAKDDKPQVFMDGFEDQEISDEEITVDLELHDPTEGDYHALCGYLKNIFGAAPSFFFDYMSLADHIITQYWIGSVIKVEDSSDIFGFISIINIIKHSETPSIHALTSFLTSKKQTSKKRSNNNNNDGDDDDDGGDSALLDYLNGQKGSVGWILKGRMEGIPPAIIPHLHSQFFNEIKVEYTHDLNENTASEYDFEYFLLLSPVYYLSTSETSSSKSNKKKSKVMSNQANQGNKNATSKPKEEIERYFLYQEDEEFEKEAIFTKAFTVVKSNKNDELTWRPLLEGRLVKEERMLMIVPKTAIPKILSTLKSM